MATYDIIGSLDGASSSLASAQAGRGTVVAGEFFGTSQGGASGRVSDAGVRGVAEGVSYADFPVLTWTRAVVADLAGTSSGEATVYTKVIFGTAELEILGQMTVTVSHDHKGMTLSDVARNIYGLWGFEISNLREIDIGRDRIVQFCNAAMQLVFGNAHALDYFNRETLQVTVSDGSGAALPDSVQAIHGDAKIDGRGLRRLTSKAQVDEWAEIYGTSSSPIAYFVETVRMSGADSLGMVVFLAPAPGTATIVDLDVVNEPPRWTAADLLAGLTVPIPHKWAETVFLPLVRYWAAVDGLMPPTRRQEQAQQLAAQYNAARGMLGLAKVEPDPKEAVTP